MEKQDVLLSVKPVFVEKILSRAKLWEFRKKIWTIQHNVDWVYIYSCVPVKQIVARFKVGHKIFGTAKQLQTACILYDLGTAKYMGIGLDELNNYLGVSSNDEMKQGYGLRISELEVFKTPIDVKHLGPKFSVPQNFRYLTAKETDSFDDCDYDEGEC